MLPEGEFGDMVILDGRKKEHFFCVSLLVLMILIIYAPHFQTGIHRGLDDSFHLSRIYSLAQSIQNGLFPVKVHSSLCYGTGYGVGFGYSNFFLYFPAVLICMGISLINAYKIYIFCVLLFLGGITYYSLFRLTDKAFAALAGCMIVLFSNRIWWDLYGLMSVGALQAYVFAVPAIVGMYLFLTKKEAHTGMLVVGFVGLIFSHVISAFLVFTVCACLVVYFGVSLIKDKRKLIELIFAAGFTGGITMSFWLPMIEQMQAQILKLRAPWTMAEKNIETLESMISSSYGLGVLPGIIMIFTGILFLYLLGSKKWMWIDLYENACFWIISVMYTLLTMFYSFWHFMNSVIGIKILQFPYRLYTPVTVLIAIHTAFLLAQFEYKRIKWVQKVLGCSILIVLLSITQYDRYGDLFSVTDISMVKKVEENNVAGLGGGEEWLPINGTREYMEKPEIAIDNEGNEIEGKKEKGYSFFTIEVDKSKEYYDLPYVYYKGYQAVDANDVKYKIGQNFDTGMLRVYMPKNESGMEEIVVSYVGTKYQKLAYVVNVCFVLLGGFLLFGKNQNKKGKYIKNWLG